MIRAILYDLEVVLSQTEKLKDMFYARAVQQIRGLPSPDFDGTKVYREVVGAPREVAGTRARRFL